MARVIDPAPFWLAMEDVEIEVKRLSDWVSNFQADADEGEQAPDKDGVAPLQLAAKRVVLRLKMAEALWPWPTQFDG